MSRVRVSEAVQIQNGFAFESQLFSERRVGLPVARIRDVMRGYSETYYTGEYPKEYEIGNGDLLIGMDGEFNVGIWRGGRALLNQRVCKIIPKEGIADKHFLKHRLALLVKQIEAATPYVTVKHLSSEKLKAEQIELPPLLEQKRIAAILEKADRLRSTRRYVRQLSDTFLQSVFLEMFGDPVHNAKGWEKQKLGDISEIRRGASPRPIENFIGGTVPWIKIGDGTKGDPIYITSTEDHITVEGAKRSVLLKKGSLIFANCGVSCGFARLLKIEGCIHDGWLAFEKFEAVLDPLFFLQAINNITLHLRSLAPEGTQPNLNTGIMGEFAIITPPLPLQQKFASIVRRFERLRAQQREAERQAEHLFQTLLHGAFNGGI